MARTVTNTDIDFANPQQKKYPWNEWLDGRVWELTHGDDYTNVNTLRVSALRAAQSRNKRVTVRTRNNGATVFLKAMDVVA